VYGLMVVLGKRAGAKVPSTFFCTCDLGATLEPPTVYLMPSGLPLEDRARLKDPLKPAECVAAAVARLDLRWAHHDGTRETRRTACHGQLGSADL
jgi:hypothetical protein